MPLQCVVKAYAPGRRAGNLQAGTHREGVVLHNVTEVQQPHDCLLLCLRYRQKRHERNFTKRIKYMCRKTLADTRPRVRGRFARNNDAGAVMPHETKKALAAKAKAGKAAAAAQSQQMQGTSAPAHLPCLRALLFHQVVSVLSGMMCFRNTALQHS